MAMILVGKYISHQLLQEKYEKENAALIFPGKKIMEFDAYKFISYPFS